MKFTTFAAAAPGEEPAGFHNWFLNDYAPGFAQAATGLVAAVVRLSTPGPDESAGARPGSEATQHPYHAVMESWFVTSEDFRRTARIAEPTLRARGSSFSSFRTTPMLELDPRFAEAGTHGARPGLTLLTPVKWLAGIPAREARRHWDEHVSTALRVHRGLTKYERNWFDEAISWSEGAVPFDAYADFSFRSADDFSRFFPGEGDRLEISQDIANFIERGSLLFLADAIPVYP